MSSEVMKGVREYAEGLDVTLLGGRIIVARNQGGHDCTKVDVLDLIAWLRKNKPELLE